ncbi:unnamed protein product [Closterium sp. NIES-53]
MRSPAAAGLFPQPSPNLAQAVANATSAALQSAILAVNSALLPLPATQSSMFPPIISGDEEAAALAGQFHPDNTGAALASGAGVALGGAGGVGGMGGMGGITEIGGIGGAMRVAGGDDDMARAMESLIPALWQSFAVILIGYACVKLEVVKPQHKQGLSLFVTKLALPALLFSGMASLDFSKVNWSFLLAVTIGKTAVFFLALGITMLLDIGKPQVVGTGAVNGIFVSQSNDFALGLPIFQVNPNPPPIPFASLPFWQTSARCMQLQTAMSGFFYVTPLRPYPPSCSVSPCLMSPCHFVAPHSSLFPPVMRSTNCSFSSSLILRLMFPSCLPPSPYLFSSRFPPLLSAHHPSSCPHHPPSPPSPRVSPPSIPTLHPSPRCEQPIFGALHPEYIGYLYLVAPISLIFLNPLGFLLMESDRKGGPDGEEGEEEEDEDGEERVGGRGVWDGREGEGDPWECCDLVPEGEEAALMALEKEEEQRDGGLGGERGGKGVAREKGKEKGRERRGKEAVHEKGEDDGGGKSVEVEERRRLLPISSGSGPGSGSGSGSGSGLGLGSGSAGEAASAERPSVASHAGSPSPTAPVLKDSSTTATTAATVTAAADVIAVAAATAAATSASSAAADGATGIGAIPSSSSMGRKSNPSHHVRSLSGSGTRSSSAAVPPPSPFTAASPPKSLRSSLLSPSLLSLPPPPQASSLSHPPTTTVSLAPSPSTSLVPVHSSLAPSPLSRVLPSPLGPPSPVAAAAGPGMSDGAGATGGGAGVSGGGDGGGGGAVDLPQGWTRRAYTGKLAAGGGGGKSVGARSGKRKGRGGVRSHMRMWKVLYGVFASPVVFMVRQL